VLDELKMLITKLLALALPKPRETLLLNIATATQVICGAQVVQQEEP
jgi:hypothetical protein